MEWLSAHWGNLASLIGVIVSVSGFAIAIVQIRKSISAAESTRQAVVSTRNTFARDLAVEAVNRGLRLVQEMREQYRDQQWSPLLARYQNLSEILSRLSQQHPHLNDDQRSDLRDLVKQLQGHERAVDRAFRDENDPSNLDSHVSLLQKTQTLFGELAGSLQLAIQTGE